MNAAVLIHLELMYSESIHMAFKSDLEALILGVLDGGDLHGYEIAKRIRRLSDKALDVGEGQLYPALHTLEHEKLVTATWVPQDGKPPRKVYQITEGGRSVLTGKRNEWKKFAEGVAAVLNPNAPVLEAIHG